MSQTNLRAVPLVVALLGAGVIGGAGVELLHHAGEPAHAAVVAAAQPAVVAPASTAPVVPDFPKITQEYGPAVVNVSVSGMRKETGDEDDGAAFNGDPFDFFRHFQQNPHGVKPHEVPMRGLGSGFIISPDGVILTNAHVVKDATEVTVKLTDRREYRAKVLGADPKTDIAVIKINASNLPVVRIGDPKALRPGEWVAAIGSPFGFDNTVTVGVVSAKGRSLPDDSTVPFIQTDVAVNPGNSGGPLFNARGEVVGINSQIYSRSGGYQGVSFAIPIDIATKVKDQIVATGKVEHAKLGVSVQEVNQSLADSFKLPNPEGALVANVEKNSPAAKAGLQTGDVIRNVDGQHIVSSGDLPAIIGMDKPGQRVQLGVWRQGHEVNLTAQLGNASDKVAKADTSSDQSAANGGKLGLALRPLDPQEARQVGVKNGLVVEDVAGAAERAGVQPGDVVLAVNGTPAKSVDQVRSIVEKADKSVALLIQRGEDKIFVPIRIG